MLQRSRPVRAVAVRVPACPSSAAGDELSVRTRVRAQVVLNFVTAYEDPVKRELVTSTREIRRNYMRGFFVIDVLSILPVNYVEWALGRDESGGDNLKTLKILRLVRLTRLLRLARVKKLLKTYTDMLENLAGVFSLLSVCVGAIFLSHFVSCVWYWVGDMDGGWVDITFNCKLAEDPTCVHEYPDVPAGLVQRYLATLWWSLTLLLVRAHACLLIRPPCMFSSTAASAPATRF